MHIDLPLEAFWAAMGFLFVITIGSLLHFVAWKGGVLTKKMHDTICEKNQKVIVKMLEDQNAVRASNHLENRTDITAIKTDVGQLKSDVRVLQVLQSNGGHGNER